MVKTRSALNRAKVKHILPIRPFLRRSSIARETEEMMMGMRLTSAAALAVGLSGYPVSAQAADSTRQIVLPGYSAAAPARLPAEDRFEILELPARFNWAVDTRDYGALGSLFTTDGVLDHDWGYVQGPAEVVQLISSHRQDEDFVRHQTTNLALNTNPDGTVTMVGYLVAVWVGLEGETGRAAPHIVAHGLQNYTVRNEGGTWKISRLVLDQTAVNGTNLPDQAMREQIAQTAAERAKRTGRY